MKKKDKREKLLIIGPPRSGTSLIASMIGAHPEIGIMIEDMHFTIHKIGGKKIIGNKLCLPQQIDINKKANIFSRVLQRMGLLMNYPRADQSINDYLRHNEMKVIGIIRDGDKVVESIQKRGKKSYKTALLRWEKALEIIDEVQLKIKDRMIIVSYDKFLQNPENQLHKICSFLNVDFDLSMMNGLKYIPLYPGHTSIDPSKASSEFNKTISSQITDKEQKYLRLFDKLFEQCI